MEQNYLKIFAIKLSEIVSYLVFEFMLRMKLLFRYWREVYRKSESKVFSLDFSGAVCSTPNTKKMSKTMEFDLSLSTVMKTAPRLTTPIRSSFSETKKKARRELFKPAQRKFLMEEEIFLKHPRKINNTNKKGLRI